MPHSIDVVRRRCVVAAAALPLLTRAADATCYVVVSLIGDRLELVTAGKVTGSWLDRNAREVLDDKSGAFDQLAVQLVGQEISRVDPAAKVFLVSMPPSPLHDKPEMLLRSDGVVLPNAVVDVIEKERATHVLLLTKQQADARFMLAQSSVGTGKLRGIGFYVDSDLNLRNVEVTEKRGQGFLGPFVYSRLSLVDARTARVVRESEIRSTKVFPTYHNPDALVPWDALNNEQKINTLRRMLEEELSTATRETLKPS